MVAGQVSVSLVLLVLALLFVSSLRNLLNADTGFRRGGIILAGFGDLSNNRGLAPAERKRQLLAMQAALLEQVRSTPGVESAASSSQFPLTGSSWR